MAFGKGISYTNQIDFGKNKFLDSRTDWTTLDGLKNNALCRFPEGFKVYISSEHQWYEYMYPLDDEGKFDTTKPLEWRKVSSGALTSEQEAQLEELLSPLSIEISKPVELRNVHQVGDNFKCKFDILIKNGDSKVDSIQIKYKGTIIEAINFVEGTTEYTSNENLLTILDSGDVEINVIDGGTTPKVLFKYKINFIFKNPIYYGFTDDEIYTGNTPAEILATANFIKGDAKKILYNDNEECTLHFTNDAVDDIDKGKYYIAVAKDPDSKENIIFDLASRQVKGALDFKEIQIDLVDYELYMSCTRCILNTEGYNYYLRLR